MCISLYKVSMNLSKITENFKYCSGFNQYKNFFPFFFIFLKIFFEFLYKLQVSRNFSVYLETLVEKIIY